MALEFLMNLCAKNLLFRISLRKLRVLFFTHTENKFSLINYETAKDHQINY